MSQKQTVSIPTALIPELEAWGKMTAQLFGRLRREAGLPVAEVPNDQAWFWADAHQAKEREVDEELQQGEYQEFADVEELINELRSSV